VSLPGSHPRTRAVWFLLGVPLVVFLSSSASAQTEESSPSPSEPEQVSEGEAPTGIQADSNSAPNQETLTEEVKVPSEVNADFSPGPTEAMLMESEPLSPAEADGTSPVSVSGWIEGYYAWNFNRPSNGITDLRGFDNRHNSVNLSNAVLDVAFERQGVHADLTLQWGTTPATYYLGEPAA